MWQQLTDWERNNNAICFMVVSTEETREGLQYYNAFDEDAKNEKDSGYICNIWNVSEVLIMASLKNAYDCIDSDYGLTYENINDMCYDYVVDRLSNKPTTLERGNLWNSETKTFETVKEFLANIKGDKNAS